MELGMVGLGKMGANMTTRLMQAGHRLWVHDRSSDAMKAAEIQGAVSSASLQELVNKLNAPPSRLGHGARRRADTKRCRGACSHRPHADLRVTPVATVTLASCLNCTCLVSPYSAFAARAGPVG